MLRKSRCVHAQSIAGRKPFVRYIYGILVRRSYARLSASIKHRIWQPLFYERERVPMLLSDDMADFHQLYGMLPIETIFGERKGKPTVSHRYIGEGHSELRIRGNP